MIPLSYLPSPISSTCCNVDRQNIQGRSSVRLTIRSPSVSSLTSPFLLLFGRPRSPPRSLISYKDLVERPTELRESISKGFGSDPDSLGIVVVQGTLCPPVNRVLDEIANLPCFTLAFNPDLPAVFPALREKLLRLSNTFASLPDDVREKYADAASQYSFGWSMGKEVMNGVRYIPSLLVLDPFPAGPSNFLLVELTVLQSCKKPDVNKGSYYANPLVDLPNVPESEKEAHPMYYRVRPHLLPPQEFASSR